MKVVLLKRIAKLTSAALAALLLSACQKPLRFEEPVMPPLTVSISSLLRFPVHYSGTEELIYEFNPQIPGFYYNSEYGLITYNGSDQVPAQSDLTVTVSDGVSQDTLKVKLKVVHSKASDITWDESKKYVEVPNQSVMFHFAKGEPDENIEFRFDGLDHYPDPPQDVVRLTPNFQVMSKAEQEFVLHAMLPMKLLENSSISARLSVYTYFEQEIPFLTAVAMPLADRFSENQWIDDGADNIRFYDSRYNKWVDTGVNRSHVYSGEEWVEISDVFPNEVFFIGLDPK